MFIGIFSIMAMQIFFKNTCSCTLKTFLRKVQILKNLDFALPGNDCLPMYNVNKDNKDRLGHLFSSTFRK